MKNNSIDSSDVLKMGKYLLLVITIISIAILGYSCFGITEDPPEPINDLITAVIQ